jgi:tyrosine-protein phosphatase YwqE
METLENLIEKGYKIVLAHVDRYPPDIIEPLSYLGIKFQVNARSLCGLLKRPILHNWIKRGIVVALGSDIHMLNKSAIAELIKCKKKLKNQYDSIMLKSYEILNTI